MKPAPVHRDRKTPGLYHVVYAGPGLHIQRIARGFWQLVSAQGGSSDHDSLREARIAAAEHLNRLKTDFDSSQRNHRPAR